ncbi:ROK family protein [Dactylosporangium sp. NPDC000521]|uniref:ROK family transcriptional regulator n=1 Tax=Dactylosporangium sp. NPDC000521 TaxID=3363975 RepID=UPI003680226D
MDTPGAAPARVHLEHLRDYNESLVVALARTRAEFDRAGVAEATGLTPQAVSKVLGRLVEQGLVEVCGLRRQGVGKPASIYRLVPGSRHAVGVHVARTTLRTVLTDLAGTVLASRVVPLPPDFTPGQLLDALQSSMPASQDLVGVGIGMVGPLDHAAGIVRDAHRLRHWHDVPLRQLAQEALALPVHLDKDVTAGVTAEAWRRGPAFRDGALIMVESGVGAGLWLGGAAYRGAHTNAGEFGHTVLQLDGPRCVCGRAGCLEILHDTAFADGRVDDAAGVLAAGIVNLLQTTDVGHIVLAGADLLRFPEVYRTATRDAIPTSHWLDVSVTLAELGADVIAAGAAMQVLDAAYGIPSKMGVRSLF